MSQYLPRFEKITQHRRDNRFKIVCNHRKLQMPDEEESSRPSDRQIKYLRWKEARQLKKKLEQQKQKPRFVISGVVHYHYWSPTANDKKIPCHHGGKHCKDHKVTPAKWISAVTQRRIAARQSKQQNNHQSVNKSELVDDNPSKVVVSSTPCPIPFVDFSENDQSDVSVLQDDNSNDTGIDLSVSKDAEVLVQKHLDFSEVIEKVEECLEYINLRSRLIIINKNTPKRRSSKRNSCQTSDDSGNASGFITPNNLRVPSEKEFIIFICFLPSVYHCWFLQTAHD